MIFLMHIIDVHEKNLLKIRGENLVISQDFLHLVAVWMKRKYE